MGAYLSQPNTTKTSADGGSEKMSYGFSAMQGWRVSMEDAHNCIPEMDEDTAMFAVYDGHGGEEVALYCSKYLPDIIKEQKTYKDGKLQKALEEAFLAIDSKITTEEVMKELVLIAGRPTEEPACEKIAEEDDLDREEAALLHEEATMTIEELLVRYGQNLNAFKHARQACCPHQAEGALNGEGDDTTGKKKNKEKEEEEEGADASGAAVVTSKLRSCRRTGGGGGDGCSSSSAAEEGCGGGSGAGSGGAASAKGKAGKVEGDAGPSCSSSKVPEPGDAKSKFFEDSEESEGGEEEDGSDEEDGSEDDEGEYSSENDEEEDTEDLEDSEDEEEEDEDMCLPGMDGKEEPGSDSGTTAVVALIRGKQLIVANAGDSRCVVSERGKAVDMSYDHKPEDELELARIKNAGGKVTMDGRVNGGLNLSRAIGDHFYKRNKALGPEEQMISSMPDVKVLTLNDDHDFMVIACDGIWNVLSSQEVVDFVSERIKPSASGCVRTLSSIVEEMLDHCLAPDTSGDGTGCDNMTCMIITFRPQPASQSEAYKKRKQEEEAEPEKNGKDSKKAKSD